VSCRAPHKTLRRKIFRSSTLTQRPNPSWLVFASVENPEHDRCIDFFSRPEDKSFGFEEFRRDVEDGGLWTRVRSFSAIRYPDEAGARAAALQAVPWFRDLVRTV
jgi:hypothetical protein